MSTFTDAVIGTLYFLLMLAGIAFVFLWGIYVAPVLLLIVGGVYLWQRLSRSRSN